MPTFTSLKNSFALLRTVGQDHPLRGPGYCYTRTFSSSYRPIAKSPLCWAYCVRSRSTMLSSATTSACHWSRWARCSRCRRIWSSVSGTDFDFDNLDSAAEHTPRTFITTSRRARLCHVRLKITRRSANAEILCVQRYCPVLTIINSINEMRYINLRFTYLLYLLTYWKIDVRSANRGHVVSTQSKVQMRIFIGD